MSVIPTTQEIKIVKIMVGRQPGHKVSESPILTNKLSMVVHFIITIRQEA
jgi:hypothetical protein